MAEAEANSRSLIDALSALSTRVTQLSEWKWVFSDAALRRDYPTKLIPASTVSSRQPPSGSPELLPPGELPRVTSVSALPLTCFGPLLLPGLADPDAYFDAIFGDKWRHVPDSATGDDSVAFAAPAAGFLEY